MMLENRLTAMGHGILQASNGIEALAVLPVVLVVGMFLDLGFSAMDGLRLLRELHSKFLYFRNNFY